MRKQPTTDYKETRNLPANILTVLPDSFDGFYADHDLLTGLLNKKGFTQAFQQELSNPDHGGGMLLLIDIDRLKHINILHGRHTGDQVLRLVADILSEQKRDKDILARLYKDKFVLALTNTSMPVGLGETTRLNKVLNSLKVKTMEEIVFIKTHIAAVPYIKHDSSKTVLDMASHLLEGRKERQSIPSYLG